MAEMAVPAAKLDTPYEVQRQSQAAAGAQECQAVRDEAWQEGAAFQLRSLLANPGDWL